MQIAAGERVRARSRDVFGTMQSDSSAGATVDLDAVAFA